MIRSVNILNSHSDTQRVNIKAILAAVSKVWQVVGDGHRSDFRSVSWLQSSSLEHSLSSFPVYISYMRATKVSARAHSVQI